MRSFVVSGFVLLSALAAAQSSQTAYPSMAPVEQYMMERNAEIALARSAGPNSISENAGVMVMGRHGYETAIKGTNGFVCVVERSWTAPSKDPNFWNPKLRGPVCLNAAAVRTYLPLTIKKTELVLAGGTKAQMFAGMKTAFDRKELPALEPGAMSYMLSKQGYLGDGNGHWHPHVMYFVPLTDAAAWGADVPGSPIFSNASPEDRLRLFFVLVAKWSDGTVDTEQMH